MRHIFFAILLGLLVMQDSMAREIEGVMLPEQIEVEGKTLYLNGAGIRSKFFFDIYVGALYLPQKISDVRQILALQDTRKVTMHFLYRHISQKKMRNAWEEGFRENLAREEWVALEDRIRLFQGFFSDVNRGDVYEFEMLPEGRTIIRGTRVRGIKKEKHLVPLGSIDGKDFQRALLLVWLGHEPADEDLKAAMLGH
ncbi:MAG: hypothetical protein D6698_09055 [Gammaproteobacteria bacterium]|nr:MAG: hypothetical protein D6698_09055 [Gammaproteobacteria bacterium]